MFNYYYMNNKTKKILKNVYDPYTYSIDISNLKITGIIDLIKFTKITNLVVSNNKITQLLNLPDQLVKLNCSKNKITQLDTPKIYLMKLNKFWVRTRNLT